MNHLGIPLTLMNQFCFLTDIAVLCNHFSKLDTPQVNSPMQNSSNSNIVLPNLLTKS